MPDTTSRSVRRANQASSAQLLKAFTELNTTYTPKTLLAAELREVNRIDIWTIFEDNMRELYKASSFGWDPPEKRAELFNPLSRFILIDIDDKLAAFAMFRFECEEEEDIIYCYDFQIQRTYQRSGLGTLLMHTLEAIGTAWHMKKIVLTVFKANLSALKFYEASGFSMDETSPGYLEHDEEAVDYIILSKQL